MSATPRLIDIPFHRDARGDMGIIEASQLAGFDFRRVYYFAQDSKDTKRGAHGHKNLRQFIVALRGGVTISVEGAYGKQEYRLDSAFKGLLVPPGSWRDLFDFTPDSFVMVFASDAYDEADYIRDYGDFKKTLEAHTVGMAVPYIPMGRQYEALHAQLTDALHDVMHATQFIGGDAVKNFEQSFAAYCGAAYAVGCGNGLDALTLILEAYGIGAGDEVIVPANSFIATALAVSRVGATPILADCDPATYGIEIENLEKLITPATKAIIPVHLYGIPADMSPLMALAEKHNLKIIEDAAQGHGAVYKNQKAGSIGHAAAFSFYPTKNLGALGDGGAVTTNDAELAQRVRLLGNYGSVKKYHHETIGWNTRLDTLQAAFLQKKMVFLDGWNQRRQDLADIYFQALKDVCGIVLPVCPADCTSVWHVFPVMVKDGKRDALQAYLHERRIDTNIHYPVPIHLQKAYAGLKTPVPLPVSEAVSNGILSLPLDPYHTDDEISHVAATLKAFF